jgi:hypothetical protein
MMRMPRRTPASTMRGFSEVNIGASFCYISLSGSEINRTNIVHIE